MKLAPHIGTITNKPKKAATPGNVPPPGRIGIYDSQKRMRGHCGPKMTPAGVARFGVHNAKLRKVAGRPAWVGSKTLADTSAAPTASSASSAGTNSAIPKPVIGGSK